MNELRNKTVLVTGGTRGIGFEAAKILLRSGNRVILNFAHDSSAARSSLNQLKMYGADVELYRADVADEEDVCAMFANLSESIGHVDALIYSSGFPCISCPEEYQEDEWIGRLGDVYIRGARLCTREFVKQLPADQTGNVILLHPPADQPLSELSMSGILTAGCADQFILLCRKLYDPDRICFLSCVFPVKE